jgi:hypothetical protein
VTCAGGSKPGDVKTETFTVTVNGKKVSTETTKSICGSDGEWHEVAKLEVSKSSRVSTAGRGIVAEASMG